FEMGDVHVDHAAPVHTVELSAYFIGKLEVTCAQFDAFARKTRHVTTAEDSGKGYRRYDGSDRPPGYTVGNVGALLEGLSRRNPFGLGKAPRDDDPVLQVSWDDARAYCAWAGLRLPSEAEWERAAIWDAEHVRALKHPWGDVLCDKGSPRFANIAD